MTKVKKMLGMVMAALLCFALTPTAAFATATPMDEGDQKVTLTIDNPAKDHVYKVYQMLTGNISTDLLKGKGTLTNVKAGENLVSELDGQEVTPQSFVDAVLAVKTEAEQGNIVFKYKTGDPVATLSTNDPTVSKLETSVVDGYYLIVDETVGATDAMSRYVVAVTGPTTVKPKADKPTLDKKITNGNVLDADEDGKGTVNTAAVGDTVSYELTATLGDMTGYAAYQIVFQDTLSAGLDLKEESIKVKGPNGADLDSNQYAIAYPIEGTVTFTVTINNVLALDAKQGDTFTVAYDATVNNNAVIYTEDNPNTANLRYSNNPGSTSAGDPGEVKGVTPDKTVKTYITQLTINKVDETGKALTGVEFTLKGDNLKKVKLTNEGVYTEDPEGTYWKLANGTYTTTEPSDATASQYDSTETKYRFSKVVDPVYEDVEASEVAGFVDGSGTLVFTGLNIGEYTISETVAPDGYNTVNDMTFYIDAIYNAENDAFNWVVKNSENKILMADLEGNVKVSDTFTLNINNNFSTTIKNVKGLQLPSTGGMGTTILYIVGGVLVVAAIAFLVVRRRNAAK